MTSLGDMDLETDIDINTHGLDAKKIINLVFPRNRKKMKKETLTSQFMCKMLF